MLNEPISESTVQLEVEGTGLDWLYHQETASTNADALNYYAQHQREVVAFSETQSAGRGRRGRQWLSPFASNIYCTIGISKDISAAKQGLLSIVTGLALCRALRESTGKPVGLKWPNDILFEDHKLGGILIEAHPLQNQCHFFAIGYGINVFMPPQVLKEIPQPVTSLEQITSIKLDRTQLLVATMKSVIDSIRSFDSAAIPELIDEFDRFDSFHDQPVEVISGAQRINGINRGISAEGELRLETRLGMTVFSAAEISLKAAGE